MILDDFPTAQEFYKTYWNKKPFIVRGAIPHDLFDILIDGDELAGLSLEEDLKSRIITTASDGTGWTCEHGPFEADKFSTLGEKNWSLLVQNVEAYHTETAVLLEPFDFAPRWLMDDIMVSYSAVGGSVGPHTDSYHVFLVQGIGSRTWKVSYDSMPNPELIDGLDMKVIKDGFTGETFTATMGDVIYIPPHFAHEGTTIENAMTFSVGFFGPKRSDLLVEYGYYLADNEERDIRYCGADLDENSAGSVMDISAQKNIQSDLANVVQSDNFYNFLAEYFSKEDD